jgi:hypothetical protein
MAARKQTDAMRSKARARYAARRETEQRYAREYYAANREHKKKLAREYQRVKSTKTPLEITVESYLRDRVLTLNGLCIKFADPAQRGAPDRIVILPGYPTFYVELKRPGRMGRLSEAQKRYHQRLRDRGQRVWTLWSKEDVDAFILEVTLT